MKIAALIRAHHRPDLLKRLASLLSSWDWSIYIHLNSQTAIEDFTNVIDRDNFIDNRIAVHWGSYTQTVATILLLKRAVDDESNTHFYILSGQCYPLKEDDYIKGKIAGAENGGNFITIENMNVSHKPLARLTQWNLNKGNIEFLPSYTGKFSRHLLPRRNIDKLLHGLTPYGGDS